MVFDRGVYLPQLDLWLDSLRKRDTSVVSHAHSDHIARHGKPVADPGNPHPAGRLLQAVRAGGTGISGTPGNARLHHYPAPCRSLPRVRSDPGREPPVRRTASVYGRPAHPTVSHQRARRNRSLRYPGDRKHLWPPDYVFPPQEEAIATAVRVIGQWLEQGAIPVVLGWRLGKAQEALHHLLTAGFGAVCEESVYDIARRYESAGVRFPGEYRVFDGEFRDGEVGIFPPGRKSRGADRPIPSLWTLRTLPGIDRVGSWQRRETVGSRPARRFQPSLQRPR